MKKVVIGVMSVLLVCLPLATAQACETHGLVNAASAFLLWGSDGPTDGFTYQFDHHSFQITAPNGNTFGPVSTGASDEITPNMSDIEDWFEANIGVATEVDESTVETDEEQHEQGEDMSDYFG